uniref:C-type lectin domain-containing protein n=1 Tax=Periophthalmus magnuspinnatus TaxID=409849 RepID=A0A3B3ZC39_9GOBI
QFSVPHIVINLRRCSHDIVRKRHKGTNDCVVIYTYHFIDVAMTWTEAQQYCRQHYTDLATIHNTEDLDKLTRPSTYWRFMGNDSNSWRWSVTGTTSTSQYQNWASGQPDYNSAVEKCLYMNSGLWFDGNCAVHLYFVSFTGEIFLVFFYDWVITFSSLRHDL